MTACTIRAAEASDIPEIVAICKGSLAATYGSFLDPERMEPWAHGDAVDQYVDQSWSHMIVAVDEGEVVGVAALNQNVVDLLWVRLDRRGQGVGSQLLQRCEAEVSMQYDTAELECFQPNTESIDFYQRHGYRSIRTFTDEVAGVGKVLMRKALRP